MLWYKAWIETRVRFLICLSVISGFCGVSVYHELGLADATTPLEFYYETVHAGHQLLAGLWLGAINFLMMGGLLRERSTGASPFTLALPFSRAHLVCVRAAVGVIEGIALIAIPSAAMWLQNDFAGRHYPVFQIWFHFFVMFAGGLVFLTIALLVSSIVDGEYTAPLVSIGLLVGIAYVMRDPPVRLLSPVHFMGASDYISKQTALISSPIPWLHAGSFALAAVVLLVASVKAIETREF